jgi:dolichol kinase
VTGPLKAAWALTAFVVLAGVVLWLTTGRPVFAVFIVLGVLTGVGAWVTGRGAGPAGRPATTPADRPEEDRP